MRRILDPVSYLSKLGDTIIFINSIYSVIDEHFVEKHSAMLTSGIRELVQDPKIYVNKNMPSKEKVDEIELTIHNNNIAKTRNYKKWLLGYGLISLCATFEEFLVEAVEVVLDSNTNYCSWLTKSEILAQFKEETFKQKYKIIKTRLGIDDKVFFDFSQFTTGIQNKFKDVDIKTLIEIYKKRNLAAHTTNYIITKLEELQYIKELFEKLILILTFTLMNKYHCPNIFSESLKKT
jgi:hypothetical protein